MKTKQHATKKTNELMINSKGKSEIPTDKRKRKYNFYCSKSSSKREVYKKQEKHVFSKKQKKSQINNLACKGMRKRTKSKVSRMKEIIKIREEINNTEIKRTIAGAGGTQ